tara:strand:+ start:1053 stop:1739 length:687 start_codon:yes stop_codon:yes gene_type:complete
MAFATIDVTKGITGTTPVTQGGTGLTAGTTDQFLKFTGTTTLASAADNSGLTLLQTVTASTSATVDFEGNFSSTYDNYIIYFNNVRMSDAPGYFGVRIKTPAGGGSYWSASNNYARVSIARRITGDGTSNDESSGDSQYDRIPLTISNLENNGDWDIRGYINIPYPLTSSYKYVEFMTLAGCPDNSALMTYCTGAGNLYKNDNLTGIQFLGETGTVSSGTFKLYGIVK